jgi:hypothetical protein
LTAVPPTMRSPAADTEALPVAAMSEPFISRHGALVKAQKRQGQFGLPICKKYMPIPPQV